MGTWGPGNLDSDNAMEFLDLTLLDLVRTVRTCIASERLKTADWFFERFGETQLMPAIDVLLTLVEHYKADPSLDIEEVKGWKMTYLNIFDQVIDQFTPKTEYKAKRRQIIVDTFERLENLVQELNEE